uniref:Uncharacterized protein n=1 Tax=Mycena chlorophos TaxID=658473 RepID=A0ABQ0L254_MYCCL|nr:predicted protein [Mycena chlorophos]
MPYKSLRKDRETGVEYIGRKIYPVQIERLQVIDGGDGAPFVHSPTIPVAPTTPVKRACNTAVDAAFDD